MIGLMAHPSPEGTSRVSEIVRHSKYTPSSRSRVPDGEYLALCTHVHHDQRSRSYGDRVYLDFQIYEGEHLGETIRMFCSRVFIQLVISIAPVLLVVSRSRSICFQGCWYAASVAVALRW